MAVKVNFQNAPAAFLDFVEVKFDAREVAADP